MSSEKHKIVVVGGGTGSFVVLSGLRKHPVGLTAVVSVTDSGGSTGRLRSEFGFLPVGDMRQCLAALASHKEDGYINKLLLYRFCKGQGLKGHNLGNLILTALTDITDSEPKALEVASRIFRLKGRIYPITTEDVQLAAEYEDGQVIVGEHQIDEPKHQGGKKIVKLTTEPSAEIYRKAESAIKEADLVVLGPGDLYTSILPNLIVGGVSRVFKQTKAKLLYIVNLMTRYSQTHGYTAADHLEQLEKHLGRKLDYVLLNNRPIPQAIKEIYQQEKGYPVKNDLRSKSGYQVIEDDLLAPAKWIKPKGDVLKRSYLRHDSDKLAKVILGLLG